jgi:hypothetical protein
MTPTAGTLHCWDRQPGSFTLTGRWSGTADGYVVDLDSRVRGARKPGWRPGSRRGRMQWLRRFRSRFRSPARRCHPGQASPDTHSLARNGLRPRNSEGIGLRGRSCLHDAQRPACNNVHAAVRRPPGQAGSGHRRPDADSHLEGHPGLAAIFRPRPVTPPRLGSRHRATSINGITPSDGEIRENARRPAVRSGHLGAALQPVMGADWCDLRVCMHDCRGPLVPTCTYTCPRMSHQVRRRQS